MIFKGLAKKTPDTALSLRDFHAKRNKILVIRRIGGLGDIFMHRMMFEDFKRIIPDAEITFALPRYYHPAAKDHPFIDHVVDPSDISTRDYGVRYDTTTRCRVYEAKMAPNCQDHRSDIWAGSCGVPLWKHEMYLKNPGKHPSPPVPKNSVLFIINSVTQQKNLTQKQVKEVVVGLQRRGMNVVTLNNRPQPLFKELSVYEYVTQDLDIWLTTIADVDYVISVDTAGLHAAAGLGKPLVGVFAFTDGKVYGKYYRFVLVQKHRDDGDWDCGPCYEHQLCRKIKIEGGLPCVTTLQATDILYGFDLLKKKKIALPVTTI